MEKLAQCTVEKEELVGSMHMALTIAVEDNRKDLYSHQL